MPKWIVALALLWTAVPATADEMAWLMKNEFSRAIVLELHSQTRDMRWPGGDKVYLLETGERKSVPIECQGGEQICYAAWVNGNDRISWGVGPDNDRRCDDCCSICAKGTEEVTIRGQ